MNAKVIELTEDRYLEAMRLSEYAFQYKATEEQIAERIPFQQKYHSIYAILDEKTQEIIAKTNIISFQIYYHQQEIEMGGVAGVATYPEHRRNGSVRQLITHSLKEMKEKEMTVSILQPFYVDFYRRYGWELFSDQLYIKMTKHDLKPLASPNGRIRRFNKEAHNAEIEQVYAQYAKRFSGMLVRTTDWWKQTFGDYTVALYYDEHQVPQGYVFYKIENMKMKIEELVVLTESARRGLWNFICQHDSMVKEIEFYTHSKDPLLFLFKEPRIHTEIKPYGMVRIVDVEKFLPYCPFRWNQVCGGEVRLQISDPFAPWNEKTYVLRDGEVRVEEQFEADGEKGLRLSINTLSTILFGYRRPQELYELGFIEGSAEEVAVFEKLVPETHSHIIDFF